MYNDITTELSTNFIEYAVAVNSDRSIPNANDGLKPVAKRILYGAFEKGFRSNKPHIKNANIVGAVMGEYHPHGDSSIYGALVRLSQNWVMRYPLIDFHGSNGNIDGDGPAAYRYTEGRLAVLTEKGMLEGIKKNKVDFIPNYDEQREEPIELPAIFPNLLCNPNSGIGVAVASNWAPHNLREVATAINDYLDGNEPMLSGPDFPTGGIVINGDDIPEIMRTGHGSVKVRGKYTIDKNLIVFTEIPYGINTEALMSQIGKLCDSETIKGIKDIRNESGKKGFRLVIEADKTISPEALVAQLFAKTDLQSTFSYNQVALVDKTPTELNLKDCIKIYVDFNTKCISREVQFDIDKTEKRIHIINGLIKAIDIIDEIIIMIKTSPSSVAAKESLKIKWGFTEEQAKAILDIKLAKLAKLEREELQREKEEKELLLNELKAILANPIPELRKRLAAIVKEFGDDRRTEITNIKITKEKPVLEEKEVVVSLTNNNKIYYKEKSAYKPTGRAAKGTKNSGSAIKSTVSLKNTEQVFLFSSFGRMYHAIANNLTEQEEPLTKYFNLEPNEEIKVMTTCDTLDFITFVTKKGIVKKLDMSVLKGLEKSSKSGSKCITLADKDELVNVLLTKADERVILFSKAGFAIHFSLTEVAPMGKIARGVKAMKLENNDEVVSTITTDTKECMVITKGGLGFKCDISEFGLQKRAGKGIKAARNEIVGVINVEDGDNVLITGEHKTKVIAAKEVGKIQRGGLGVKVFAHDEKINSIARL